MLTYWHLILLNSKENVFIDKQSLNSLRVKMMGLKPSVLISNVEYFFPEVRFKLCRSYFYLAGTRRRNGQRNAV